MQFRIGNGIDFHQLAKGESLIISGVLIPYNKGSVGHSDGDVVFHSAVDAILGALSAGDIGEYFPSNESKWKNANSQIFLQHAFNLMKENQYCVENFDVTIILQEPFLKPYIKEMKNNISSILNLDLNRISIKSTTTDKMGFIGKSEGIAAMSSILIKK